jgi:hypothetical protein
MFAFSGQQNKNCYKNICLLLNLEPSNNIVLHATTKLKILILFYNYKA